MPAASDGPCFAEQVSCQPLQVSDLNNRLPQRFTRDFERLTVSTLQAQRMEQPEENAPLEAQPQFHRKAPRTAEQVWREWGRPLLIFFVSMCIVRSAVADWNDVPTGSMNPAIFEGDRVWVNKLAYDLKIPFTRYQIATWDTPRRGDVVVFFSPQDGTRMIKRVIGLPGDEVGMVRNSLYINGERASYRHVASEDEPKPPNKLNLRRAFAVESILGAEQLVMATPRTRADHSFAPVLVPEGQYLMLGDNRDLSSDSRYFGFVPEDHIVGQATSVVLSFDRDNRWAPRWERFFTELK
jgi:signal peptidase I